MISKAIDSDISQLLLANELKLAEKKHSTGSQFLAIDII